VIILWTWPGSKAVSEMHADDKVTVMQMQLDNYILRDNDTLRDTSRALSTTLLEARQPNPKNQTSNPEASSA
jgi:hypothetical protein